MTEEQARKITASLRGLRAAKRAYEDLLFDVAESFVEASIDRKHSTESVGAELVATQKRFVSRKELASVVGLSVRTISELQAGGLPVIRTGRRVIFDLEEAVAWIKEGGTRGRKRPGLRVVR
jgi:hypothetical protein